MRKDFPLPQKAKTPAASGLQRFFNLVDLKGEGLNQLFEVLGDWEANLKGISLPEP